MRVFEEKQSFNQWWIAFIAIGCAGIPIAFIIDDLLAGETSEITVELIIALAIIIISMMLFKLSLHTKIDQNGIKTWWEPFHFLEKEFPWKNLQKVYIRTYQPIQEYGGWGIRGIGKIKAFNVSGNKGIQLVNSNGKFLVGTQKASEAELVIKKYSL